QLQDMMRNRAARGAKLAPVLFQPRNTVRMRIAGGYGGVAAQASASRGPAWPGMVNYARTGASIIRVLPQRRPEGSYEMVHVDSGKTPPNGVVVLYYLPEPPRAEVSLTVLDAKGRVLRRYSGPSDKLSAKAGANRFLWNRRLPGAPNVLAADLEPVNRPDGP